MKDFYCILGCSREDCSNSEIKQLYFNQLRKLHPDKNQIDSNVDEFVLVNQAWAVLGDLTERKKYDCWLKEQKLRESKELIGEELCLDEADCVETFVDTCRCGGEFRVEVEELEKILDYGLFECSNCSLLLKIWRKSGEQKHNEQHE